MSAPRITPELIKAYREEGERLRDAAVRRLAARIWQALTRRRQRDPLTQPLRAAVRYRPGVTP